MLKKWYPAVKEININDLDTRSVMSGMSSRYNGRNGGYNDRDSDTSSVYSMATSTTSYSVMTSSVALSHRGGGH